MFVDVKSEYHEGIKCDPCELIFLKKFSEQAVAEVAGDFHFGHVLHEHHCEDDYQDDKADEAG